MATPSRTSEHATFAPPSAFRCPRPLRGSAQLASRGDRAPARGLGSAARDACAGVEVPTRSPACAAACTTPRAPSNAVALGSERPPNRLFSSLYCSTTAAISHLDCPRPSSDAWKVGSELLALVVRTPDHLRGAVQLGAVLAHFFPHGSVCHVWQGTCQPHRSPRISHFFPCDERQRLLHRTGRIPAGLAGPGGPHKSA